MNDEIPTRSFMATPYAEEPFVIHSMNNYTNVLTKVLAESFGLADRDIQDFLRVMHRQVVDDLAEKGIDYSDLSTALTPRSNKYEIAFVFNSKLSKSSYYGEEFSRVWLSALRSTEGPTRTAVLEGDIIGLPPEAVWQMLDKQLVNSLGRETPRLFAEEYFVVYFTNVSIKQVEKLDMAIGLTSDAYLGYIDCSGSSLLKTGLPLVQVALRIDNKLITSKDEDGFVNSRGYPFSDFGFETVGVEEDLYGTLLDFRIDMGVSEWAAADGAIALGTLSGAFRDIASMELMITDSRFEYLKSEESSRGHGASIRKAGLDSLSRDKLANAIKRELDKGLLFNLRSVRGSKLVGQDRVEAPENDALLFTVQVEFPDDKSKKQRYQVGVKYNPAKHRGEVTTMFG